MIINENYNAILEIRQAMGELFEAIGIKNGDVLTTKQITETSDVLYYHITAKKSESVQKSLFITYKIAQLESHEEAYLFDVYLSIYSRNENEIYNLLNKLEQHAKEKGFSMLLSFYNYDVEQKTYNYDFVIKGVCFYNDYN